MNFDDFEVIEDKVERKKTIEKFDRMNLIVSLIASIVSFVLSTIGYNIIKGNFSSYIAIGFRFFIYFALLLIILFIYNMMSGNIQTHFKRSKDHGSYVKMILLGIVATLVFGSAFEFLYERNFSVDMSPNAFLFATDKSSSMNDNDPIGKRYDAIDMIIDNKADSFPYALYSFNGLVTVDRPFGPKSNGSAPYDKTPNGGTNIMGALKSILDDYKNGEFKGAGNHLKVILLSDGDSSTFGINSLLKKYKKEHISISTVGLGNCNMQLLEKLATSTGGVFIQVDNVDQLESAMEDASAKYSDDIFNRTFFTYRIVFRFDMLYGIARIVFTFILGMIISLIAGILGTGRGEDSNLVLYTSLIKCFIATIFLEVGINIIGLPEWFMSMLYFISIGLVFVNQEQTIRSHRQYVGSTIQSDSSYDSLDSSKLSNRNTNRKKEETKKLSDF